jgi:hypothetical protein
MVLAMRTRNASHAQRNASHAQRNASHAQRNDFVKLKRIK